MKALLHAAALGFVVVQVSFAADNSSLRDQLALAGEAADSHAQIELIRRILEQTPSDHALRGQLASLWLGIDDFAMTEREINGWPDAPASLRAQVLAEVLYRRDGKKAAAIAMLEERLAENPDDLETARQLAQYLNASGEQRKVIDLLMKTPGVGNDAELLVLRAGAKRSQMDFDGALKDFAQAEQTDPESSAVTSQRAAFERLATGLKNIRLASAAMKQHPGDAGPVISRAHWYLYAGVPAPALEDANAVLDKVPGSTAALLLSAQAQGAMGKLAFREARENLAIDLSKSLPLDALGRVLKYDLALLKNPGDAAALAGRSAELAGLQQDLLALKDADAALKIDAKNAPAHLERISALARLERRDDAAAALREFAAAKPAKALLATALSALTQANFRASQFDEALDDINQAISLKPAAPYYKQRAAILTRLDRSDEAAQDLARAAQLEKGTRP
ncbi:MAG TPA: hypothetical protein PLS03_00695 [Terrimicrobiaceae bacterium]|nr:hypothetical protein [Terrimicrobiaceae bacterium]